MKNNYFGNEEVLKEQFPLIYDAVQRGNERNEGGDVIGRQDIFGIDICDNRNSVMTAQEGNTGTSLCSHFNYLKSKSAVMVETDIRDQHGVRRGGNNYVFSTPLYNANINEPIVGLCLDGQYTIKGTTTFTSWSLDECGRPVLSGEEIIKSTGDIVVTPETIVKSVTIIDPVNKYSGSVQDTFIVYGKRAADYVSYRYEDAPSPVTIGTVKYAEIWCPFKIEIELSKYQFCEKDPLSNSGFSVNLESAKPEEYGGGGVSFAADFEKITKTLSDDNKKLTIEIPVKWKSSITVKDMNIVVGRFKFNANFSVNYNFVLGGVSYKKMTKITAATDVIPSSSAAYVNTIKMQWGCLGKNSILVTEEGDKKIAEIKKGDKILANDGTYVEVISNSVGHEEALIEIKCVGKEETLSLTDAHPVLTKEGFIPACDLCMGDTVYGRNGEVLEVEYAIRIDYKDEIYNIETANHTPFIASGIVVGDKDLLINDTQPKAPQLPQDFIDELKRWSAYKNGLTNNDNVGDALDELIKYKNENEKSWFDGDPNITAVVIGHRFDQGIETDDYIIYIFTSAAKKSENKLADLYDHKKVVFIKREEPTMFCDNHLRDDPNMYRPLLGGVQISHIKKIDTTHLVVYFGTLGMLVKRKDEPRGTYILTNWHVLGELNNEIFQPIYSGADSDKVVVAKVVGGGFTECGDVGLAKVKDGFQLNATSILEAGKIKDIFTKRVEVGQLVYKRGRTTKLTYGKVKYIEMTMRRESCFYKHQIEVEGFGETPKFCEGGDSGSIVLTYDAEIGANNNEAVGLLWGGYPQSGGGVYSSAEHIFNDYNLELFRETN